MSICFIKRSPLPKEFDKTGVINIFEASADKIDSVNKLWINQGTGNNMSLSSSNCTLVDDNGIASVNFPEGIYGRVKLSETPITIYGIFRGLTTGSNWSGLICKELTSNQSSSNYDMFVNATNDCVGLKNITSTIKINDPDYHVYCLSNGKAYADGVYLGNAGTYTNAYFNQYMRINQIWRNGWTSGNINVNYRFIAFGTVEHSEEQIINNCEYLTEKYIVGD